MDQNYSPAGVLDLMKDRARSPDNYQMICQVSGIANNFDRAIAKLAWLSCETYKGETAFDLRYISPDSKLGKITDTLLQGGIIAPGFNMKVGDFPLLRPLKLLEDLGLGKKEDGSIVMFQFAKATGEADKVIVPGKAYRNALTNLAMRERGGDVAPHHALVELSDGTRLAPLVFGKDNVMLMQKQQAFAARPTEW